MPEGTSSRVQRGTRRIPAPLGPPANPLGGAGSPWASAALGAAFFAIYLLLALYYYALIKSLSYLSRWIESRMPVL